MDQDDIFDSFGRAIMRRRRRDMDVVTPADINLNLRLFMPIAPPRTSPDPMMYSPDEDMFRLGVLVKHMVRFAI